MSQPKVLARAAVAALCTALVCYPRLALSPELVAVPVALAWPLLLWCVFILWAFVFAWQYQYSGRPAFNFEFQPELWIASTLWGLAWAALLHFLVDPQMRLVNPRNYPADAISWAVMCLFSLAFEPLYLYFAPFAFFIRLSKRQPAALALTVLFGVFILYVTLSKLPALPSFTMIVALIAGRVMAGFLLVYFYLRGGVLLVWWLSLVLLLRHLLELGPGR